MVSIEPILARWSSFVLQGSRGFTGPWTRSGYEQIAEYFSSLVGGQEVLEPNSDRIKAESLGWTIQGFSAGLEEELHDATESHTPLLSAGLHAGVERFCGAVCSPGRSSSLELLLVAWTTVSRYCLCFQISLLQKTDGSFIVQRKSIRRLAPLRNRSSRRRSSTSACDGAERWIHLCLDACRCALHCDL